MQDRIEKIQSVLIPKNKFPHEHQAIKQVEKMGLNPRFKLHPHGTQNYWRFRQFNPIDNAQYTTLTHKNGVKEVIQSPHMLGRDGHGIWKPEYQKQKEQPVKVPQDLTLGKHKYDMNRRRA